MQTRGCYANALFDVVLARVLRAFVEGGLVCVCCSVVQSLLFFFSVCFSPHRSFLFSKYTQSQRGEFESAMLRRTAFFLLKVKKPQVAAFTASPEQALHELQASYSNRLFGASPAYIDFGIPTREFVPFFMCRGEVDATYTATVSISSTYTANDGKTKSTTSSYTVPEQPLHANFFDNDMQVYGGYKYDPRLVGVVAGERVDEHLRPAEEVDMSGAAINLFEMSTVTLRGEVRQALETRLKRAAEAHVRKFQPNAAHVQIHLRKMALRLDHARPAFLPVYVFHSVQYDEHTYTMFVCGLTQKVRGPYLLNPHRIARVSGGVTALALFGLLSPARPVAFVSSILGGLAAYYAAFVFARALPGQLAAKAARARAARAEANSAADAQGSRPGHTDTESRMEFHADDQQWAANRAGERKTDFWRWVKESTWARRLRRGIADEPSFRSSPTGGSTASARRARSPKAAAKAAKCTVRTTRSPSDAKGYYALLGLRGQESIDEIRSAYRVVVLRAHPDVGGSDEKMMKVNEAYRVLRDPAQRKEYDELPPTKR